MKNFITNKHSKDVFASSFEDKYIIMDNLEEKAEPIIQSHESLYNYDYFIFIVALRGTLRLVIGGTPIDMRANDVIAIKPCMSVEVKESRCIYFSYMVSGYIMNDIYEHTALGKEVSIRALSYTHLHFTPESIYTLLSCYKRIKHEHQRKPYPMQEMALRAYQTATLAKLVASSKSAEVIEHVSNSRQHAFFKRFIEILSRDHKKERSVQYYAGQLNISPKYLSAISQTHTGLSASQVIDQYVTHAIKQTLYAHEDNIKTLSKEFNFPSQSFFGRFFKRVTGMSPNEYIKKNNRKSLNFVKEI
ncbi:MAG: AraC family transcriptional regulator [Prevotellaceae bacterium]|nr:AraC family transcriptional regulator [Prevotellaceae bacterium]